GPRRASCPQVRIWGRPDTARLGPRGTTSARPPRRLRTSTAGAGTEWPVDVHGSGVTAVHIRMRYGIVAVHPAERGSVGHPAARGSKPCARVRRRFGPPRAGDSDLDTSGEVTEARNTATCSTLTEFLTVVPAGTYRWLDAPHSR